MSNTLALEMKQGWTGLLVEPDPSSFARLRSKHRKAWAANACLSMSDYPKKVSFICQTIFRKSKKLND
ncbi:UNVERIFIED_CONTAM: hypothetical protein GTU68_062869 [Idotea baltica]|nr:hypothetical protein [Idotea baltica]